MSEFLVWFIGCFSATFGYTFLYCKLSNVSIKSMKYRNKLFFLAGVLLVSFLNFYKISFVNFILFFVFYPLLFYSIKKTNIKKLLFYVIFVWLLGALMDIIIMFFFSLINFLFKISKYKNLLTKLMTLIVGLLFILFSKSVRLINLINSLYNKFSKIKYSDFALVSFGILVFFGGCLIFLNLPNLKIDILIVLIIILAFLIFLLLLKYKINENENANYLETLRKNNEFYMQIEDDNREFKHNLIAKLLSIKSVSNKKGMALIEDLIRQFNKSIDFSESIKVIPYGLNGIIYQKLYAHLKELNVKIVNDLNYDIFTVLKPRRYNVFVEKLVLALDNAIESSLNSHDKILVINIYDEDNLIVVDIKNSFANDIDIDMLGSKNYSTKGNKRGIGLFSMLRDREAEVSIRIVNNLFVSKITTKKRLSD